MLAKFVEVTSCKVCTSYTSLEQAPAQSRMFGFQLPEAPVPLGKYIFDGDIITFGNTQLEAIHVPGHSPGSIACSSQNSSA